LIDKLTAVSWTFSGVRIVLLPLMVAGIETSIATADPYFDVDDIPSV
jgi:hypothetical protein